MKRRDFAYRYRRWLKAPAIKSCRAHACRLFEIVNWALLTATNLVCALLSYSLLACALARLHWRKRGILLVVFVIILSSQIWLVPQFVSTFFLKDNAILYWVWFADWPLTPVAVVLLWQVLKNIPPDRADAAKMDGCGTIGIFWHIVLPLVRRTLLLSAIFTIMAMAAALLIFSGVLVQPPGFLPFGLTNCWLLVAASMLMTFPVLAIFFFVRNETADAQSVASV